MEGRGGEGEGRERERGEWVVVVGREGRGGEGHWVEIDDCRSATGQRLRILIISTHHVLGNVVLLKLAAGNHSHACMPRRIPLF